MRSKQQQSSHGITTAHDLPQRADSDTTDIHGIDSPRAREILNTGKKLGVRDYRLGYWLHQPEVPAKKICVEIRSRLKELAAMNDELGVCALVQNDSSWAGKDRGPAGGDLDELYDLVKDFDP